MVGSPRPLQVPTQVITSLAAASFVGSLTTAPLRVLLLEYAGVGLLVLGALAIFPVGLLLLVAGFLAIVALTLAIAGSVRRLRAAPLALFGGLAALGMLAGGFNLVTLAPPGLPQSVAAPRGQHYRRQPQDRFCLRIRSLGALV